MDYEFFSQTANRYARKAGTKVVECFHNEDKKIHVARFSDGMTMTANKINPSITCRWGSGHQSMIKVC